MFIPETQRSARVELLRCCRERRGERKATVALSETQFPCNSPELAQPDVVVDPKGCPAWNGKKKHAALLTQPGVMRAACDVVQSSGLFLCHQLRRMPLGMLPGVNGWITAHRRISHRLICCSSGEKSRRATANKARRAVGPVHALTLSCSQCEIKDGR